MSESDDDCSSDSSFDPNVPSARGGGGGVVLQEHDIVVSTADDDYMEIIKPELERLVDMRQKGQKPDVKETAEVVISILRETLQRTGGRYLQLRKKPSRFEQIDEAQAKEKIKVDLNSESRRMYNKRNADASQTHRQVKKMKSDEALTSNMRKLDEGWAVRPRRATKLLRDDMPFKEKCEDTPNPIGRDVVEFVVNPTFKHKEVAEDDKLNCIGQLLAKELVSKGHRWAVKLCEVKGNWELVTFKDCNNLNSQMEAALAGVAETEGRAFVGYKKLAEYVMQNGLLENLIKDSSEVKRMIKKLHITKPPAASKVRKLERTTDEVSPFIASPMQHIAKPAASRVGKEEGAAGISNDSLDRDGREVTNTAADSVDSKVSVVGTVSTSKDVFMLKFEQLQKIDDQISERINSATRDSDSESTYFYSAIKSWLANKSADISSIENFDEDEIEGIINQFEMTVKKLVTAKECNDAIAVAMYKNWIACLTNKLLL